MPDQPDLHSQPDPQSTPRSCPSWLGWAIPLCVAATLVCFVASLYFKRTKDAGAIASVELGDIAAL
jgi:Na+(H+)/acetate symporter ActP